MTEQKDVFISYNTKDQEPKNELITLFDENDISYFLDENDLKLGENIETNLKANLKKTQFTILIVTKKSLLSAWVGMETMFRLQQENTTEETKLICVAADKEFDVYDPKAPVILKRELNQKKEELEALRQELKDLGEKTEVYDTEINRMDNISVSDMMIKVKEHLGVVLTDPDRKTKDLEKLITTIKGTENIPEQNQSSQTKSTENMTYEEFKDFSDANPINDIIDFLDNYYEQMGNYKAAYNKIKRENINDTKGIFETELKERLKPIAKKFLA